MKGFIKQNEERIKELQKDINVVSLAKISELTSVNKRLKRLLTQHINKRFYCQIFTEDGLMTNGEKCKEQCEHCRNVHERLV